MSVKGSHTTSDYIEFDTALRKGNDLLNEPKKAIFGLYILTSINTGLRVSDVLTITWEMLREDSLVINEKKTGKRREIAINQHLRKAIEKVDTGLNGLVFKSQKGTVYSNMTINRKLKDLFATGKKKINISSHSLRKSFGRAMWTASGESERALIYLSEIFNHVSSKVTRKYLGIRQEEYNDLYNML